MGLGKFYLLFRFRGTPVYFHWSAALLFGVFLVGALLFGLPLLFIALGILSILIVHEIGHTVAINHFGYQATRIDIFPVHGRVSYNQPYSEYENCVIAWGGVLAQLLLFIPAATILAVFGRTSLNYINVLLVVFSYINAVSVAVNLAPARGLDGSKAWKLFAIVARARWSIFNKRGRRD